MVLYRDEILFWMYNGQHFSVRFLELFSKGAITCQSLFCTEKHDVLAIKYLNIGVAPYALTQSIYRYKPPHCELLRPIIRPLLIDMMCATLKRNSG